MQSSQKTERVKEDAIHRRFQALEKALMAAEASAKAWKERAAAVENLLKQVRGTGNKDESDSESDSGRDMGMETDSGIDTDSDTDTALDSDFDSGTKLGHRQHYTHIRICIHGQGRDHLCVSNTGSGMYDINQIFL